MARENTNILTYEKNLENDAKSESDRLYQILTVSGIPPQTLFQPGGDNNDCGQLQTFLTDTSLVDSQVCPTAVSEW